MATTMSGLLMARLETTNILEVGWHRQGHCNYKSLPFFTVTPPNSSQRADVVANGSNGTHSRPTTADPINDDSLSRTTAPALLKTNYSLPRVSHDRGDFSSGFGGLTTARDGKFETPLDEGYNSENIANRNVGTSASYVPTRRPVPDAQHAQHEPAVSRSQPLIPHVDQHASNVADWNIVRNDDPLVDSRAEAPHPLKVKKRSSNLHAADTDPSGALKHDTAETRDASWSVTPLGMERSTNGGWPLEQHGGGSYLDREVSSPTYYPIDDAPPRLSLDKPLPLTPLGMMSDDRSLASNSRAFGDFSGIGDQTSSTRSMQDSAGPFNLDGVDVKKEPDTVSVHEHQAPAVTHEIIQAQYEEVRQEVITRETHDYHVYHRILPIIDIEVLPARHFVPIQDGYVEIDEEEVPGRTRDKVNWAIAEMVTKALPESRKVALARQHFSARTFEGPEYNDKEYIGPEGHPVKEKWWVHPPTLCEDAYRAGQTHPFHFGAERPEDNGLKAKLPTGNIVGVSRRLMERRQREAKLLENSEGMLVDEPPSPRFL
jgi:hypothetical protein